MFPSLPSVIIRQATSQDISAVTRFVDQAILVHRNLDWQPLMEWVPREPFLLRFENAKLTSLFSCAPDPHGIAWIHAFAMDYWSSDIDRVWSSLLESSVHTLRDLNCNLYTVALHDWYERLLKTTGFSLLQNIVVLRWEKNQPQRFMLPREIMIRTMEPNDLNAVSELDQLAFAREWVISKASLECAYYSAAHATVAELDGVIIGYELSTSNHLSAHLTRLAVHPGYKHAYIGLSLAQNMLIYFSSRDFNQITVNTQDDNTASINLYQKLGFKLTGDSFPVYWRKIAE